MQYEIVTLPRKTLAGFQARTSNNSPDMQSVIGKLWQTLFAGDTFQSIAGKCNDRSIGLYSGYSAGGMEYDVTVGCEVEDASALPQGMVAAVIPAGRYAKCTALGDDVDTVAKLWGEIWNMPLDRAYTGDFEEYFPAPEGEKSEVHIYIALR